MRFLVGLCCVPMVCFVLLSAQSKAEDPYSLEMVRAALKSAMEAPGARTSFVEKHLGRRGDAVSVALIKILDESDLRKAETVQASLNVIRQAFSSPQSISIEADKTPKVTMFFLLRLREIVTDVRLRSEIEETIRFVKSKTTAREQS